MLLQPYILGIGQFGIGVYAFQNIEKYSLIYQYHDFFVQKITYQEYKGFPEEVRKMIYKYAYTGKPVNKEFFYLNTDDSKFMNHSENSNTYLIGDNYHAKENILAGQEILCNYNDFCEIGRFCFDF